MSLPQGYRHGHQSLHLQQQQNLFPEAPDHFGASLEEVADPTDSTYNPRPEWYFLFLARRDREWLTDHFTNPQKSSPKSIMPRLHLLPEEITALVAYMQSLGGEGPFTPEAPNLFTEQCAACHTLDGQGGDAGPDLTTVRSYRDKQYIVN